MADGCVFFRRNRPGTTAKVNKNANFHENLLFSCPVGYLSMMVRLCTAYLQKYPNAFLTYLWKINERSIKKLLFTN